MTAGDREESGPLRVTEVTTLEGLRALRPAWNEVLRGSETRSPFLTHEWILSWWEVFGREDALRILVLADDRGVAGIAPFALARRRIGPFGYRAVELVGTGALRFLGMGLADRADLLLTRRHEQGVAAVLRHLLAERSRWDVVDLRFVPEHSTTARALPALGAAAGLRCLREPCGVSPYLSLTGSYEAYLSRRGRSFRSGLKRSQARLEEQGPVQVQLNGAPDGEARDCLARIVEVSRQSWKGRTGTALLTHPQVQAFFDKLLPRLAARNMVYVALLTVGESVVSYELGFRWDDKLWSYDSAFSRPCAAASPGTVLTARLLEGAWDEGLREYDFLRGDHAYKRSWRTEQRRELQIVLHAGSPRAVLVGQLAFRAKWVLKRNPWIVAAQSRLAGALRRLIDGRRIA